jgi:hypothetical protein
VVTLIISGQGVAAGSGATSGCQYGGTIEPRTKVNLYDLSLVTGIGYFDANSKRHYLAALNKYRTIGMGFTGFKP